MMVGIMGMAISIAYTWLVRTGERVPLLICSADEHPGTYLIWIEILQPAL